MTVTAIHPRTAAQTAAPPEAVQAAQPASAKGAAPASAPAPAPVKASTSTSTAQQQAALRQLLTRYTYDQSHGVDAATLTKLGRQITSAAKALGQHVTLPRAPAAQAPATPKSKVDVTA